MQFPIPGLPASRWQGFYQPLAGLYASETLADLSGKIPEFRVLEFYCIIWVYWMNKGRV